MTTSPAPVEVEEESVAETVSAMLPSWLTSAAVHLFMVLLLALITIGGGGGFGSHGIELDLESSGDNGGGGGDGELLAAAIEMPSELTAAPTADHLAPQPIDTSDALMPSDVLSKIELSDIAVDAPPAAKSGLGLGEGTEGLGPGSGPGNEGGGGTGGLPIRTALFGLVGEGSKFVYVFDRSDSMNSTFSFTSEGETVFTITPLAAAKAELLRSLNDLEEGNLFHLLFYNHEVWKFDDGSARENRLVIANARNKRRAINFVNTVYGAGRTRHVPPLEAALKMEPDIIFLLTDGEEKDDPSESELRRLQKLNDGRTKINVIQFCHTLRTGGTLVRLAEESGGRHTFMNMSRLGAELAEKELARSGKLPPGVPDAQGGLGDAQPTADADPDPADMPTGAARLDADPDDAPAADDPDAKRDRRDPVGARARLGKSRRTLGSVQGGLKP
jgi:hypothetical protein